MAAKALGSNPSSSQSGDKDPLEKAQDFTHQMAADSIVEAEVAKKKAEKEEAEAKAEEAKARARAAREGGGGQQGFQVKGGVDLGTINLQQEREKAEAAVEAMKKEAEEQARATGQENAQLRDKIHEQELNVLKITFQAQLEGLTKIIERMGNQKSFVEQYNEAMETAKTLGMNLPSGQGGDLTLQIELKKLEFEQAKALKEMARAEKAEERRWQIEVRRLDDERKAKEEELQRGRERDQMFASWPQAIGGAIAQGVMGRNAEAGQGAGQSGGVAANAGKTGHHVEAPWGEAGEFNCPECNEVIGVGPTARTAACPNCGVKIPIKRTGEKTGAQTPVKAQADDTGEGSGARRGREK
jgi:hypothetical protein